MAGKKKAHLRRIAKLLRPAEARTRAGRAVKNYKKDELAQTVITFSTEAEVDALREKLRRYLKPNCYKGTRVRHLERKEQKWLLRVLLEAYYTEGYSEVLHQYTSIDNVIEELVARRVVPEPWSDEYKGKGLYNGQLGSQEKAQARIKKGSAAGGAIIRKRALDTRDKDLDGGAAAPGLDHGASYGRQKTRGSDAVARAKKLKPPKASEETAFLRKHGPEPTGCCDGCERPLASSIDALGLRAPIDFEHVKGGHNAGRLRSHCTTDKGCNEAARADIDAMNRSLHAAGQPPLTAEVAERLAKLHLAASYRLTGDDPDYDGLMREVRASQAAAAAATCTERDRRATVASETRSGETDLGGRVTAIAASRRKPLSPRAQEAYREKQRQERAAKKAKREAVSARRKAARLAAKGKPPAPPAYRRNALPPAPAPRGPRKRVAVEPYDPASEAAKPQWDPAWSQRKAANPAKRRRRK